MDDVSAAPPGLDPIARARELGPHIADASDEIERDRQIAPSLLQRIVEARLPRMRLPRSVGGDEIEPWIYLRAIEELGRHDGSVGRASFVANSAAPIAPFIPLGAATTIYDDPRGWIAWGPPNEHGYTAVPGGYGVSSQWHFASGSRQATWMGMHGQTIGPGGSRRLNRSGKQTVKTLLFPKRQRKPVEDRDTLGMRRTAFEGYRRTWRQPTISCSTAIRKDCFSTTNRLGKRLR
jgi:alkylation response protein AidB-like acyl-CoA dehydrogenase